MKKIYYLVTFIILSLFAAKTAFSATEVPYYAASGIEPNVLIILDRSGSMSWDVGGGTASEACPAAAYSNPLSATGDYSRICIARQVLFDLLDANNNNNVTDTPTATADQTHLGVRLGYSRFISVPSSPATDASEGGYAGGNIRVIDDVGTAYTTLWSNINSLTTGGFTPLGTALSEAFQYFQNASAVTGDACYTNGCRKNYVILVTDGADTVTCTAGSESVANRRATVYAARALRNGPDGIAGNADDINVFIVGFGGSLPTDLQRTLNWAAYYGGTDNPTAANSGATTAFTPGYSLCDSVTGAANDPGSQALSGYAFLASNASELATAIEQAINEARTGSYTRSQPVLTASGNRIYAGFFDLPGWKGHLDAWNVDTVSGAIQNSASSPPCTSSGINAFFELYDAGATLTNSGCSGYISQSQRKALTAVGSPILSQIWLNTSSGSNAFDGTSMTNSAAQQTNLCNALNISGFDCAVNYTSTGAGSANELINFIRFSSTTFNGSGGTRDNAWRLGDIWHSTPTIVGPPIGRFRSVGYNAFRANNANRQQVILVGGNDGMLHAFDDNGGAPRGRELWSFMPNNLLEKLKNLSIGHEFFTDASPTAGDVCLNTAACGKAIEAASDWKTVLISGERDGGNAYFALDITDTTNPSFMWQFTDPNLGNTWSKPAIGKVRLSSGSSYEDRWVAFFGGGNSITNNMGNSFYIVDISTGALLGSGANRTRYYPVGGDTNKIPAAPRPVDFNGDYYVDRVFFADTGGSLWMLDIRDPNPNNWTNTSNWRAVFNPSLAHKTISCSSAEEPILTSHPNNDHTGRPIYYMPAVSFDSTFRPLLMFGTGFVDDYIDITGDTIQNYFYVVRLENRSYTDIPNPNEYATELVVQALNPGERIVSTPVVFGGHVFYSTYQPPATANCCDVGTGYIRWNELKSCGLSGTIDVGSGIPAGPVVVNGKLYINTSNSPKPIDPCSVPGANCPAPEGLNSEVIYWREQ